MLREMLNLSVGASVSRESEPSVSVHAAPAAVPPPAAAAAAAETVPTHSAESHLTADDRYDGQRFASGARDQQESFGQSRDHAQDVTSPRGGARRRLALIDEWEKMSFATTDSNQP